MHFCLLPDLESIHFELAWKFSETKEREKCPGIFAPNCNKISILTANENTCIHGIILYMH